MIIIFLAGIISAPILLVLLVLIIKMVVIPLHQKYRCKHRWAERHADHHATMCMMCGKRKNLPKKAVDI